MIILKKISYLLILYIYINLIFGNCTGCNILFNMCNETVDDIDSCNTGDLYILQEIINLNDLNKEIINLGYQEWYNGRLVSFILINNNIYSLPETIGGLSYLEGLDLEFNYISILPESFGDLNNLKYLDLSSNDIESLPDSFFNLYNLETLGLYNNQLRYIQSNIENFINLDFINLSYNNLISIPQQICNLPNINWSSFWIDFNHSYIYNNMICPPYPECIEEDIGYQDISECISCSDNIGDINNDSFINILDIVFMANCILLNNCEVCSDLNDDGNINILDIMHIITILLEI